MSLRTTLFFSYINFVRFGSALVLSALFSFTRAYVKRFDENRRLPASAASLSTTMQLADRIAIPALIVTSIGVVATLYTIYIKLSESSLRC